MGKRETIYYAYPGLSSFVKLDIAYLAEETRVLHRDLRWKSKPRLFLNVFLQGCSLLRHFRAPDAVVVSFAGYHSFLPVLYARLRRIPVFIVLNGTDSVGIKALHYGSHLRRLMRFFCRFSVRNATELWPVSAALIEGRNDFTGSELHYGIHVSFPEVKTPFRVIPNGFELEKWQVAGTQQGRSGALTAVSAEQFHLKGVGLFLEAANAFPEIPFSIVGMDQPEGVEAPANVQFLGRVPHARMKEIFAERRYYLQLSSFEGFGCSLCEAMLSGCIPVGSNVNAIPEIIGETGSILKKRDISELANILRTLELETTQQHEARSRAASDRIRANYPIGERIATMLERIRQYRSVR